VHTGQNFDHELNEIFFEDLGLRRPDHYLHAARDGANQTMAAVLAGVDEILRVNTPDAVLVLGDTNSSIGLLAAKKLRIPTFHMEAGNRCFDARVPEEINRRMIDHIADVNLPYSALARERLIHEGIDPSRVIVTGSPMGEVLHHYRDAIEASSVLDDLGVRQGSFFVASLHREENIDDVTRFLGFVEMFNRLTAATNLPVVLSTHPRTRAQIERTGATLSSEVRLVKPLSFTAYVKLQIGARAVLSDSGTISEEASILGFNAVNLRNAHERPEAMEEAAVVMVGNNADRLLDALEHFDRSARSGPSRFSMPRDYAPLNVSEKMSRIIISYTDLVKRSIQLGN
jgi:UDP-N-acetylglucosamine 2-epimerase (non-hydrolysing)